MHPPELATLAFPVGACCIYPGLGFRAALNQSYTTLSSHSSQHLSALSTPSIHSLIFGDSPNTGPRMYLYPTDSSSLTLASKVRSSNSSALDEMPKTMISRYEPLLFPTITMLTELLLLRFRRKHMPQKLDFFHYVPLYNQTNFWKR